MSRWERIAWFTMAAYFSIAAYGASVGPTDDTDPPRIARWFPDRSGLQLYKDHGTGCEYIRAGSIFGTSSLTPRLDESGKPMCRRLDSRVAGK